MPRSRRNCFRISGGIGAAKNHTTCLSLVSNEGVSLQFGGGPHPEDWYDTLDAVCEGRLDPLPSVGATIGLDEVPAALELTRTGQGPPRVVIHPER